PRPAAPLPRLSRPFSVRGVVPGHGGHLGLAPAPACSWRWIMAIRRIRTTLIVSLALAPLPVATAGEGPRPPDGGGGLSHEQLPHDPVPFFVRANMELELWESAQRLRAQGLLPEPDTRARV